MANRKKQPKRKYSTEFKANSLILLDGAGYPQNVYALEEVAAHIGVSGRSLRRWWNELRPTPAADNVAVNQAAVAEIVRLNPIDTDEIKSKLGDILIGLLAEVQKRINENDLGDAPLTQLMTGIAIAVDKVQLLSGKPTQITKTIEEELADVPPDEQPEIISYAEQLLRERRVVGSQGGEAQA